MSLIEDLKSAENERKGGRQCPQCLALVEMPEDERAAFDAAMISQSVSKRLGAEILQRHGYDVGVRTLEGHYRNKHQDRT